MNHTALTNLEGITWVPVLTAAKTLKVSRQRVYKLAAEGKLVAIKMDGCLLISFRSVHDRLAKEK